MDIDADDFIDYLPGYPENELFNFVDFGDIILPIGPFDIPHGFDIPPTEIFRVSFTAPVPVIDGQWIGVLQDAGTLDILVLEMTDFYLR